jgi:two-component system NtrC family sensor kinase
VQAAKLAAVGEMAAGIAHELNNPLTSVTGFAELVMDDLPQDAESRADLELVLREARRARDVVRRLLDFARQSESTRARASLNDVVRDVVALTRHLIHTNGVELKLNITEDLPWVLMDENQIKQVLLNLVHNALQAMPDGGEMEITTLPAPRLARDGVVVTVRDTGVGIPIEDQARIFEPFYTTKGDQGGTGLGLSVTYGIVTDHGGQIEVASQVGVGSIFSVWLPV